jgi:hypothetical protein
MLQVISLGVRSKDAAVMREMELVLTSVTDTVAVIDKLFLDNRLDLEVAA